MVIWLKMHLVSGLTAVGYDVIQIGPMPTPAIAYLTESMRCDAGIMISALIILMRIMELNFW